MIVRCREGVKKAIDFDEVAQGLNKRIIIQQAVFQVSFFEEYLFHIGLHRISGLFYIRYPAGYLVSSAGYPARKTLHGIFFLQNLGLH